MSETREERLYDLVLRIATDYVELSYEKAECQRNDYRRWCRRLIEELAREEEVDQNQQHTS